MGVRPGISTAPPDERNHKECSSECEKEDSEKVDCSQGFVVRLLSKKSGRRRMIPKENSDSSNEEEHSLDIKSIAPSLSITTRIVFDTCSDLMIE
jgi:hypothetical protein